VLSCCNASKGGTTHAVEGILGDGDEDGVVAVAQQHAHHGMHALAGAVCEVKALRVAGEAVALLNALNQRSILGF
jgi:predicted GNAT family acetyltransferase